MSALLSLPPAFGSPELLDGVLVSAFLQNVPDYVYFKDRESRFLAVSASLLRHCDMTSDAEIIGKTDFEIFAEGHAGLSFADELKIMRSGDPVIGKMEKESWPDGRVTWVQTSKLALHDEEGEVVGTMGISKDATAQVAMETSLAQTRRELANASRLAGMAEVATGVLHNVGNVLNSLNVSANVIAAGLRASKTDRLERVSDLLQAHAGDLAEFLSSDPKGRMIPEFLSVLAQHFLEERTLLLRELEALEQNIGHIKEIVFMQQAYATVAGILEPLAPVALMEDSVRMNAGDLARPDLTVSRNFGACPSVIAERGKVMQILINLIRNARHAVDAAPREDKCITLSVQPLTAQTVRFTVADNGVGIAPENLTRIFGHGFTTRAGGHGFGLHTSALAAKEMQGSLTVASAGPGQGAAFMLDLPAVVEPAEPQ
jgi:PAS domain S-box-containing protein